MQTVLNDALNRRKNRAIAIIMSVKERDVDPHLPPAVQQRLRKTILDQLNDVTDFALDMMRSLDNGQVTVNEAYVELVDSLTRDVTEIKRLLTTG